MTATDARETIAAVDAERRPGPGAEYIERHAREGRKLLTTLEHTVPSVAVIMDRTYEGDATRQLVLNFGDVPVVPPKQNRLDL